MRKQNKILSPIYSRSLQFVRWLRTPLSHWFLLSVLVLLALIPPIASVVISGIFAPFNDALKHIAVYFLPLYLKNTLLLISGTGLLAGAIGISAAWFIVHFNFKGKTFFSWALVLPLAIPAFIQAYIYSGILGYQGSLNDVAAWWGGSLELDIFNLWGGILIMAFSLYPYVYLIMRGYFATQSSSIFMVARSLKCNHTQIFWRVGLPMGKNALFAGIVLVVLETLNEFGLVNYFGIPTLSVGIFRTWFNLGDREAATKLATILLLIVLFILFLNTLLKKQRTGNSTLKSSQHYVCDLNKKHSFFLVLFFSFILLVTLVFPLLQEFYWLYLSFAKVRWHELFSALGVTLLLTIASTFILMILGLVVANTRRFITKPWFTFLIKVGSLGYSVPGSIIAIGVLIFISWVNQSQSLFAVPVNSVLILILGYVCRFFLVVDHSIDNSFAKIGDKYHLVSRSLGVGFHQTFFRIDLPMISPSLGSAFALIFVEVMKELSLTVNLRPYNTNTLATLATKYVDDGRLIYSAMPSLLIILCCAPILIFFEVRKKRNTTVEYQEPN